MNAPVWGSNFGAPTGTLQVTAANGSGYTLSSNGSVSQYDANTSLWGTIGLPTTSTTLVDISTSTDSTLAAVDDDGQFHVYSSGSWSTVTTVTSGQAIYAAVGDANSFVVADDLGIVYKYAGGFTESLPGGPVKLTTTAGLEHIWGLDASGNVLMWDNTSWQTIGLKTLKQLDVSLSSSGALQVCGVDGSGNGWTLNTTTLVWTSISKPVFGSRFVHIEGGSGFVWGALSTGAVYRGTIA